MMLVRFRMLLMTDSSTAPITVPVMPPAPPLSAVPPTMTAAIASNSHSKPVLGDAEPSRGTYSSVAMPTDQIIDRFYQGVAVKGDMGPNDTFYANDKAKRMLGFVPKHGWRDIVK